LNPGAFGLDYGIFGEEIITTSVVVYGKTILTTIITGDWASQASITHFATATIIPKVKGRNILPLQKLDIIPLQKRDSSVVPAVCYATCNDCYIEAQRVGLSPGLCTPSSPFESDYGACQACVAANGDSTKISLQTYVEPEFQPFIDFCNAAPAQSEVQSTSTAVVTPPAVTQSVVVATQTAPTPTISVAVTSQVPANTPTTGPATGQTTGPATTPTTTPKGSGTPSTTETAGGVFTSSSSSSSSATTSVGQVTTNSGNGLRPSSFLLSASILFFSALALLL
jgi:hypothetical protein